MNRRMEENKENQHCSEPKKVLSVSEELHKLSEIEKSVQNMKMHLTFLAKQEELQEKKINVLYNTSLRVAKNKINHVSTHLFVILIRSSKNNLKAIVSSM